MDIEVRNQEIIDAYHSIGAKGKNIIFDVLDTGVTAVGNLVGHVVNMTPDYPEDTAGHGTMVSTLIINACPDAEIRSYCVIPNGKGTHKNIQTGLDHVLEMVKKEPDKQHIVNMSLSGKYSLSSTSTKKMQKTIQELTALNVQVVCAAGNDGKRVTNAVPGCFQEPFTASAITKDMKHAGFATIHGEVDFSEHGEYVLSRNHKEQWVRVSGTSFACPILAAKIGLLQSAHKMYVGRWMNDSEVYQRLLQDVHDLGDKGRDDFYGYGYVDLKCEYSKAPADEPETPKQPEVSKPVVLKITSPLMESKEIKALQVALNGLGYSCGAADGKCGKNTMAGIAAFCNSHTEVKEEMPKEIAVTVTAGNKNYKGTVTEA